MEPTKIEAARIRRGLSRQDLARLSGVALVTLHSWAARRRVPRDVYARQRVARVLGTTIEELIEPEPRAAPGPGREPPGE